jgi:nicotinate dehydrogenase subunit B
MEESLDLEQSEMIPGLRLNRRHFLKITGNGIFLYFTVKDLDLFQQEVRRTGPPQRLPTDFNAFLKIGEDGRVTCYTGKIEMGQGPVTSLAMELADELDVSLESVDMVMGDTDLCPWDMGTFGSMTTRFFGPPLREAGAEARQVLLELGAESLRLPVAQLATEKGEVFDTKDITHRVSYAQLAKGKRIDRHVGHTVPVKKPSEFRIIGKSELRRDAQAKVTGAAKYTGDIQLPGMVYAKLLRPPAHGAKLLSVDVSGAEQVEGVQVVRDGDFVAVLHQYPDVAETALAKVKARFDVPKSDLDDKNIYEHLLKVAPAGTTVTASGDLKAGEHASKDLFDETYYDGYYAHSPMEPHTAVVHIEGSKATVWASTQTPFSARDEVARELAFQTKDVRVITPFVGGGFGGKSRNLQAVEAARCAKLSGKPVQVAWTRREEFFYDSYRPAAVIRIRSGISAEGRMTLWDYHVYFAGDRGARPFYNIPNEKTTAYNNSWTGGEGTHPFATGAWRAPGNNTNTFARESHIDIMASKAGIDPLEFRMRNLTDDKMKRVLRTAADKFGWKQAKAPSGRGQGIACGIDAGTTVAACAEVEVDKSTGAVRVKHVVAAQDMGLCINPEGATIQMEGCITMGLGYALKEHVRFKGGDILEHNFDTYEIPRFSWLPKIETVIIDNKEEPPQGGGEPAIIVMGAVIANAIYDAVGVRMHEMAMTPARVLAEVKKMK